MGIGKKMNFNWNSGWGRYGDNLKVKNRRRKEKYAWKEGSCGKSEGHGSTEGGDGMKF